MSPKKQHEKTGHTGWEIKGWGKKIKRGGTQGHEDILSALRKREGDGGSKTTPIKLVALSQKRVAFNPRSRKAKSGQ